MSQFAQLAAENGADVSVKLTEDNLDVGDSVVLYGDEGFKQREVAGFEDGILNPIVVLDDGTKVDYHCLSEGDGLPKGGDLFAPLNKE